LSRSKAKAKRRSLRSAVRLGHPAPAKAGCRRSKGNLSKAKGLTAAKHGIGLKREGADLGGGGEQAQRGQRRAGATQQPFIYGRA